MTADDVITVGEKYAVAATTGNLKPNGPPGTNRRCDADFLLAAAYAAGDPCGHCRGTGREGGVLPVPMGMARCHVCGGGGRIIDQRKNMALAAWRMRATGDLNGLYVLVNAASGWLAGRLSRSGHTKLRAESRRALVVQTLSWWLNSACLYCDNRGKLAMEDAGRLTEIPCEACHGERKRPLARDVPHAHVKHAEWLATQLDQLLAIVFRDMSKLLNEQMDLKG